jgi:hypothetical protein
MHANPRRSKCANIIVHFLRGVVRVGRRRFMVHIVRIDISTMCSLLVSEACLFTLHVASTDDTLLVALR